MINEMTLAAQNPFWQYFIFSVLLILTGVYCMTVTRNLIRVLIGMELMTKGVTLILTASGYLTGNTGLSQALIVTLIVVEVVVISVAAGVVIGHFRKTKSLDTHTMNSLQG
ncbi:MAG: NADH-quinone oxidoreductase subunit K [Desulfuromonadales bacterium]|nr:NADH-quinone oxidoreductase subunit K [Desulfuromonadales bacterium]